MVHTSYWLEYRIWQLDPTGYHVVNLLLHAVAAVLVWRLLKGLGVPAAWAAAAIFALHPVHVESVAWITERKNVLSGVFYLGSALAYLQYTMGPEHQRDRSGSRGLYAASLALFLCALLSKTVTLSLPAALLLVLWWKRGRTSRADVYALIPFFAIGVVFGLLTLWIEMNLVGTKGEAWELPIIDRWLLAGRALWFYAYKLSWPMELMFIYPRWELNAHDWRQYLFPAAAMGCVLALWLGRSRIGRGPLVAVLFFAGTLVPALGFFNVYPFRYSFVADHFQYLASLGLITLGAALGQCASDRFGSRGKGIAALAVALILGLLGLLGWRHQHQFSDLETLWRSTLERNPDAWIAHNNLGNLLHVRGEMDEAADHYLQALQLKPDFTDAHHNLALVLQLQGRPREAIKRFRMELGYYTDDDDPRYKAEAYGAIADTLRAQGRLNEAIEHYHMALETKPDYAAGHNNLGIALYTQGKYEEAITRYRRALEIASDNAKFHNNLGSALFMQGKLDEAITHYRRALAIEPSYADARRNLRMAETRRFRFTN
jgi:tetratricopeptide (TPR) repeat protein